MTDAALTAMRSSIEGVLIPILGASATTTQLARTAAGAALGSLIDVTGGPDHIMKVQGDTFTLQHPLAERLDASLFDCDVFLYLGDPRGEWPDGEHAVWIEDGAIRSEPVEVEQ